MKSSVPLEKIWGIQEQEDCQTVLRAAGETETTPEDIQDFLEVDEEDSGCQLLTEVEIVAVILLFIFIRTTYIIEFPI
jgi:hypothetical protein